MSSQKITELRTALTELIKNCKSASSELGINNSNLVSFNGFLNNVESMFHRHLNSLQSASKAIEEDENQENEKETKLPDLKRSNAFIEEYTLLQPSDVEASLSSVYTFTPIGILRSVFCGLFGIPRQSALAPHTKASLTLRAETQPTNSLRGLSEYSHCILTFVFHKNTNLQFRPLVFPPKKGGTSSGLFGTRSPHRWNNIGLSIAKIEKIEKDTVFFSGIDLLDGTPILDIKPYVIHDSVPRENVKVPDWIRNAMINHNVVWTESAEKNLHELLPQMKFYSKVEEAKQAINECLCLDQRTAHMIQSHEDKEYGFCFDNLNVVYRFKDNTENKESKENKENKESKDSTDSHTKQHTINVLNVQSMNELARSAEKKRKIK